MYLTGSTQKSMRAIKCMDLSTIMGSCLEEIASGGSSKTSLSTSSWYVVGVDVVA